MFKNWSRTDRLAAVAMIVTGVLGLLAMILTYLTAPPDGQGRVDGFVSDLAAAISAPIPVPAWLTVIAVIVTAWAATKALSHKVPRPTEKPVPVDPIPGPLVGPGSDNKGFEPTDLQKHLLRKLRDSHGFGGGDESMPALRTLAEKVRQPPAVVENALNKLDDIDFVYVSHGVSGPRYRLSAKGLEYAVERLDQT